MGDVNANTTASNNYATGDTAPAYRPTLDSDIIGDDIHADRGSMYDTTDQEVLPAGSNMRNPVIATRAGTANPVMTPEDGTANPVMPPEDGTANPVMPPENGTPNPVMPPESNRNS